MRQHILAYGFAKALATVNRYAPGIHQPHAKSLPALALIKKETSQVWSLANEQEFYLLQIFSN